MSKSYSDILLALGKTTLIIAIFAFAAVSFFTTFRGFQSFLPVEGALIAALALQATLLATEVLFAHIKHFRARLLILFSFLFVLCCSITFSYIGLREIFATHVAAKRDPIYESESFRQNREKLQKDVFEFKGNALDYLDRESLNLQATSNLADADINTRRLESDRLRSRIAQAPHLGYSTIEISRLQRLLDVAVANAGSLRLNKEKIIGQKELINSKKESIQKYNPDVLKTNDKDWSTLSQYHKELAGEWGLMPDDFKKSNPLPLPPSKPVLRDGKIAEGQDHPTIEALASITKPAPHEIFALALASVLDLIPFIALLGTREKKLTLPMRIALMRRWMREVRLQVDSTEGLIGWIFGTATSFFFYRATTSDDPRTKAFRKLLNELRMEMEEFLQTATLPSGIVELLQLRLTTLYSRSEVMAYEAARKLENLVLQTYQSCTDEIELADLDESTKNRLKDFLNRQMEKFDEAVETYSSDDEETSTTRRKTTWTA